MRRAVLAALTVALVVVVVVSAGSGAFPIGAGDVVATLRGNAPSATVDEVLWQIRFPRIALAVLVGASLSLAGAVLQGLFRNPLAEPGVIGVSAGAALGAVIAIVAGVAGVGTWGLTGAAFVGGLAATTLAYRLASRDGAVSVVSLILTGVAVNAFAGAGIGLATFLSTDAELRSIAFWNLGSVAAATWGQVAAVAPLCAAAVLVAAKLARQLDLLSLGDAAAGHLGVDLRRLRAAAIALVALLTAAAVSVAGVVSFVGLVVPHLVRMVLGPGHRVLLPASALAGGLVLLVADLLARTMAAPAEVPLGLLTAAVGGPFFLILLRQRRPAW